MVEVEHLDELCSALESLSTAPFDALHEKLLIIAWPLSEVSVDILRSAQKLLLETIRQQDEQLSSIPDMAEVSETVPPLFQALSHGADGSRQPILDKAASDALRHGRPPSSSVRNEKKCAQDAFEKGG